MIFNIYIYIYIYYQCFLLQTLTIYETAGEGRGLSFIPLCQFYPLTNIETFICNCMWDDYHAFLIATLVFTRLLLDEIYHLIELPFIAWLMMQCLSVYLKNLFYAFVTAISHGKPVDLNSHRLLLLYYKRTD